VSKILKYLVIPSLVNAILCAALAAASTVSETRPSATPQPIKKGLQNFALGVSNFKLLKYPEAEAAFTQSLDEHVAVSDYVYLERGLVRHALAKNPDARKDFEAALNSKSVHVATEARFQLLSLLLDEKSWKLVVQNANLLRRKLKNSERYPEILYDLLLAEKKLKARTDTCKIARELYGKYPTFAALKDWNQHLERDLIDGEKTGCTASAKDFKSRLRRLQLGGEPDRAVKELGGEKIDDETSEYGPDSILANQLIGEGQMNDAFKLILKHYETENSRPPYLMLLGKAATRSGDYQAAISAYDRAYAKNPGGKRAGEALFQAAFTSYQIQDYDGSTRRFEKLVKVSHGRNKWTRDARWYLAWMRYLRGDYQGSYDGLVSLMKEKPQAVRRRRRHSLVATDSVQQDRLRYWAAMCLLKLGRNPEAITQLQTLVRDPSLGFYAVLSYYRLTQIPGGTLPPGVEVRLGIKKADDTKAAAPTEEELKAATEAVQAQVDEAGPQAVNAADESETDADEAETEAGTEQATDEPTNEATESFKDQSVEVRFERVRDLIYVGLVDAARDELSDIERRVRRPEDRKLLMSEYQQVKNFNRSSIIGEMGFAAQRLSGGLKGESRKLWEFAYPRAWDSSVQAAAKATGVPEEMIWGIMRAESHYRVDAQSAVGALGLMQLMPNTGHKVADLLSVHGFETRSLLESDTNIKLGSRYLQRLVEKFSGSVPLVAAAYNAGPHRVHAWVRNFGTLQMDEFIEHIPFVETRNYVKKVVRNYQMYSWLYGSGAHSLSWLVQPVGVRLEGPIPTKEVW
jgi:soluble lytic murein transglycosylase